MPEDIWMVAVFAIPLTAILGGIAMGIVRMLGQQRLAELARRERIAAIERGIDPDKLGQLVDIEGLDPYGVGNGRLRRAHGLMIAGLVLVAVGIGLMVLLQQIEPQKSHWVLGLMPFLVGFALLAASKVVWPKGKS
ncbi:MAG TPA: hypothetical protein VJW75_06460 [Candidatus Eisenbacteria bacterium]|nr:hypothetical protein [Candidatus Eisenbacteria bacterium]